MSTTNDNELRRAAERVCEVGQTWAMADFDPTLAAQQLRARMGVPYTVDQLADYLDTCASRDRTIAAMRDALEWYTARIQSGRYRDVSLLLHERGHRGRAALDAAKEGSQ